MPVKRKGDGVQALGAAAFGLKIGYERYHD